MAHSSLEDTFAVYHVISAHTQKKNEKEIYTHLFSYTHTEAHVKMENGKVHLIKPLKLLINYVLHHIV